MHGDVLLQHRRMPIPGLRERAALRRVGFLFLGRLRPMVFSPASVPQVRTGTLAIRVGGDEDADRRVEPLLRVPGTPEYVGENGQGFVLKLWFDVELIRKDIELALATAHNQHVALPSASVAAEVLTVATEKGFGHRDIAAHYEIVGAGEGGEPAVGSR
jgi:3-hydroxyisobutyrate dehydrogenase-like beta-hydroxyacid dehydrogenase